MRLTRVISLASLALGLIGLVIGGVLSPSVALAAYLGGFAFALSIALGCLILVIIAHATNARWMLMFRRFAEVGAATLFVLLPAFLPLLLATPLVYRWAADDRFHHPWLQQPYFTLRSLGYFAVWIAVSEVLLYFSLHQDPNVPSTTGRMRTFAAASIWPIVLTFTFASFDWFMSLDPGWVSSMYPVYFFAGSFISTLGLIGVLPGLIEKPLAEISPSHRHALGKLELTFVIFWAYIAFCQFMLVWMADLPAEVPWYLRRMSGAWGLIGVGLVLGQFALPFFILLSRQLKRRQRFLTAMGIWLLFVHWLDVVWLIVPSAHPREAPHAWWLHVAALFFFGGLLALTAAWRAGGRPLVARADPLFAESLRYRTQ